MSIESRRRAVARCMKQLADLKKKDSDEAKREASKKAEEERILRQLNSTKNESSARSFMHRLSSIQSSLAAISEKRANLAKQVADKTQECHCAEQSLSKEQQSESKKLSQAEKRRRDEQLAHERAVTNELRRQKHIISPREGQILKLKSKIYDVFICHASEDKESFVDNFSKQLTKLGVKVWYDEGVLAVGDSLRRKIDEGLVCSRYGVVVLSASFFSKEWPQRELDGLVSKESDVNGKVILPIWHSISKDEVLRYSPILADRVALKTALDTVEEIAQKISEVVLDNINYNEVKR